MIISAILTAMRSAAIAALKTGKVVIKVTAKAAKVTAKAGAKAAKAGAKAGAKAAKATGKAASKAGKQAGKAAKKAGKKAGSRAKDKIKDKAREKAEELAEQYDDEDEELEELEDPSYNRGKRIRKAGVNVLKTGKFILSKGFILAVGIVEDIAVLLLVTLLIFGLILLVCIVSVFGTFSGVLSTDTLAVSSNRSSGNGMTSVKHGGVKITDPSTYDWWGNRDQNRILLNEQWDKDLYDVVACSFELYKETKNNDYYWDGYQGAGTTVLESGMPNSSMFMYTDGGIDVNGEKSKATENMAMYLFKAHWCSGGWSPADDYGDGPTGNSFIDNDEVDYSFGPFKASDVSDEEYALLRKSISACPGHDSCVSIAKRSSLSDNALFGIYTVAGSFMYDYKYITSRIANNGFSEKEAVAECMQGYGLCKDKNNLTEDEKKLQTMIVYNTYYNAHHGSSKKTTVMVAEYLTCLIAYSDNHSFDDWTIIAKDGTFDSPSDFSDSRDAWYPYFTGTSTGVKTSVLKDGKTQIIDDTLPTALKSFAESKGRGSQWSTMTSNLTTNAYLYNANMSACVTAVLGGRTFVNYLIDKLGIVFESEDGEDSSIEVSGSTPGGTMTAKNVVATAQKIYNEHGVNSSDPWTYGNYDLVYGQNGKFIECKNSNADWCAMFVTTVLYRAKINGSNMSVGEALHKETGGNFPTSQSADCGYSPGTGNQCNLYTATSGDSNRSYITGSGCVIVHNLGNVPNAYGDSDVHSTATKDSNGKISKDSGYVPKAGDIIIYSWDGWHLFSHVGLVCEDGKGTYDAQTIEGNTGPGSCVNKKNGAANAGKQVSTYVEINYAELERKYGKSSTSSTTDESGVFKVDSFVKNTVKTGIKSLDSKTKKLIDVSVNGTSCTVTTYEKKANDKWDVGSVAAVSGYIGKNGVASASSNSTEGSNKTPYGTYYCRTGFGNGSKDSIGVKMSTWHDISSGTHTWSGSGTSAGFDGGEGIEINKYYKGAVSGGTGAETISAYKDSSYKYSMFIEYNSGAAAKAGQGSAFFLHLGSQPTAGCVAVSEADMLKIAKWADDNTVICIHNSSEVIERQSSKSK